MYEFEMIEKLNSLQVMKKIREEMKISLDLLDSVNSKGPVCLSSLSEDNFCILTKHDCEELEIVFRNLKKG